MRRWIPSPLLSISLLAMWLLLNQSVEPAHLLLGGALALGALGLSACASGGTSTTPGAAASRVIPSRRACSQARSTRASWHGFAPRSRSF